MSLAVDIKFSVEDQGTTPDQQIMALISILDNKPTVRGVMIKEMSFKDDLFRAKKKNEQLEFDMSLRSPLSVSLQLGNLTKEEVVARGVKVHLYGVYRHENGHLKAFKTCLVCNMLNEKRASQV